MGDSRGERKGVRGAEREGKLWQKYNVRENKFIKQKEMLVILLFIF